MKCSQCGWDVASVWRFCPWCGVRLINSGGTGLSMPAISDTPAPPAAAVAAAGAETGLSQPAIALDAEATGLGQPAIEIPGEAEATSLGAPALALVPEATSYARAATDVDGEATGVSRPAIEADPDATSLGRPAVALDPDATSLGAPAIALDPDATSFSQPAIAADSDVTGIARPNPFDADATMLGAPPVDADATMLGAAPVGTSPPARTGRPPTGATPFTPSGRPPTGSAKVTRPPTSRTKRPSSAGIGSGAGTLGGSIGATGPLEIGEAFGPRYHIIRMLGIGGMGAVYQAWDSELEVALALKVIRPDATNDPEAAAEIERRFKRELLLARQVTHPNVVRIHDLGEIDGIKYITMPYVEGKDLSDILAETGTLPVPRTLAIAKQVASGLVAAHEAGVVHRDLKPANIMIDAEDRAMIMDFGIARASGGAADAGRGAAAALAGSAGDAGATRVGTIVGTLDYMAPEQARGVAVDQRADVYAFGLILYRMLVGKRLADGATNAFEDLKARMQAEPQKLREIDETIPEHVESLISKCLQPDADARFQTTVELLQALERLDENGIPLPEPPPIWKSPRFWAAAASIMTFLVGGTWWLAQFIAVPVEVKKEPVSVLIADIQNGTGDPAFDHTLEPMLKRALEGAEFISAYDRNGLRATFGVKPPEKLDEAGARELAAKQGVGFVLSGSIEKQGSRYEMSVTATETVTGKVIATDTARASSKDDVLPTTANLVATVRTALGDEMSDSAQMFAMASLSATSLDVLHEYAAAREASSRGQYDEARQNYAKAVELDPKFGIGYQALAGVSMNQGNMQEAEKHIKEALRYLDGMTERERYTTRGMSYTITGDYQQCAKEYTDLIARYPAEVLAHNNLALCLTHLRDMPGALEEMREVVQSLPTRALFRINLALYANYASDFQAAEKEARAVLDLGNKQWGSFALAYAQLGQGQLREAAATYEALSKTNATGASQAASGLGDLAIYEGRFSDAVRILEAGAEADIASKNADRAAAKFLALAHARMLQQKKSAAVAAAQRALAQSQAVKVRFLAARVFVQAGDLARARPLIDGLAAELHAEPQAYAKILQGEAALKQGDARQAIKVLTEANSLLDTWIGQFALGRAYLETEQFLLADSAFDRSLKRRGEALALFLDEEPTYGYFPPVYYYQGRVREGLKTAGFAESYRAYLAIRGQSKEDPLVAEVRKRVGTS